MTRGSSQAGAAARTVSGRFDAQDLMCFSRGRNRSSTRLDQLGDLLYELCVAGGSGPDVVFKTYAHMAAASQCGLGEAGPDHVAALDSDEPRQVGPFKHRQIGVETGCGGRQTEQKPTSEVQLEHRAGWKRPGIVKGERDA